MAFETKTTDFDTPKLTEEASRILGLEDNTINTPFTFEDFTENFPEDIQDSQQIYDSYITLINFAENGEIGEIGAIKGITQLTGKNDYKLKLWANNIQSESWRSELWSTLKSNASNFVETFPSTFKTFLSNCSKWSERVIHSQPNGWYKNMIQRPFYTACCFCWVQRRRFDRSWFCNL